MGVMVRMLESAAAGSTLILVCAALRGILKNRLLPGVRLGLWGVCLFRLLSPAVPVCPWSVWGLLGRRKTAVVRTALLALPAAEGTGPAPDAGTVLTALYLLGAAAVLVWTARGWIRARREVSRAPELASDDPRYDLVPRRVRLREGPVEGAPLTFGVLRPVIVLSPGLTERELTAVLAHEGVHARRRDNLWNYVTAAALVLYWWDPAVWLLAGLLRRDVELSCDRAAAASMTRHERAEYARTILDFSTQAEGPPFCRRFGQKQAEERIVAMLNFKKMSIAGAVVSLALVGTLGSALATAPEAEAEPMGSVSYEYDGMSVKDCTGDENAPVKGEEYSVGIVKGSTLEIVTNKDGLVTVATLEPDDLQPVTEEELTGQIQKLEQEQSRNGSLDTDGQDALASARQMLETLKKGGEIYRLEHPDVGADTFLYIAAEK